MYATRTVADETGGKVAQASECQNCPGDRQTSWHCNAFKMYARSSPQHPRCLELCILEGRTAQKPLQKPTRSRQLSDGICMQVMTLQRLVPACATTMHVLTLTQAVKLGFSLRDHCDRVSRPPRAVIVYGGSTAPAADRQSPLSLDSTVRGCSTPPCSLGSACSASCVARSAGRR